MPTFDRIIEALHAAYFLQGYLYNAQDIRVTKNINCIMDVLKDLYNEYNTQDCIKGNVQYLMDLLDEEKEV